MDDKAQIHILEVVLVASILFVSLYFLSQIEITINITASNENKLEEVGDQILSYEENLPDPTGQYSSMLAYYIDTWDLANFTEFIDSSIPLGTTYTITKVDVSGLQEGETFTKCKEHIYSKADENIGRVTEVSKFVVINGRIYEVILTMYSPF